MMVFVSTHIHTYTHAYTIVLAHSPELSSGTRGARVILCAIHAMRSLLLYAYL